MEQLFTLFTGVFPDAGLTVIMRLVNVSDPEETMNRHATQTQDTGL
ncbi:hypothetical protein [Marinobacterium weihaiense]|uniref:Uncharacterized protein n=1 Tax=Marinobacterium weihaiense TaxID=2851016 RepID=A0ABS6M7X2_9GAMM|nr:hypothetical protein [Marinobacterium weihaiense]MBV0932352.1 hypothetical protein [Marinobacterium weihaiense]